MTRVKAKDQAGRRAVEQRAEATIRFAGDSGDGMQLVGAQFTYASALAGNDISTLPDFPAEIRAPAGSLAGVSGFQVHFGKQRVHTPGDALDALIAMNPAALKANLCDLKADGILVVNGDAFTPEDVAQAGYAANPLTDGSLAAYRLAVVNVSTLNREALAQMKLSPREADRCKNFFALGLACWLYQRPLEPTLRWIRETFATNPGVLEANSRTLKAGYHYGETTPELPAPQQVAPAAIPPGKYRKVTGIEALALGLTAAAAQARLPLVFAAFPSAPASELLPLMGELTAFNVRCVQAEDEIAAAALALGAAFGGALGATACSGPGLSLKSEVLGLAVMTELPCIIIDLQRAGPSTGMPTKPEQADLLQALCGRHGECPLPVLAPASPADCFAMTLEAARLAITRMTPVIVLADGQLAHGAEAWRVPDVDKLPSLSSRGMSAANPAGNAGPFQPYARDERSARPWAKPGTPGLEHRVGGLEKEDLTGNVSYDPANHEAMVRRRAEKIAGIADDVPELTVKGPAEGDLLVIGWGSTAGAIHAAVERQQQRGRSVAAAHLRYLNPLPRNTGVVLRRYKQVLVPELNTGQLLYVLRSLYLVDAIGLNKIQGRPFHVAEIEAKIDELLLRNP
jgi:2-oxoglutarate/2-oxoacid ferredoxin oxidoreductase subunit alpha